MFYDLMNSVFALFSSTRNPELRESSSDQNSKDCENSFLASLKLALDRNAELAEIRSILSTAPCDFYTNMGSPTNPLLIEVIIRYGEQTAQRLIPCLPADALSTPSKYPLPNTALTLAVMHNYTKLAMQLIPLMTPEAINFRASRGSVPFFL
jgi:hypothetical protein